MKSKLSSELKNLLLKNGASLVAFGDLSNLNNKSVKDYPIGISIAVALDKNITKNLINGPSLEYYDEYLKINEKLKNLACLTVEFLEKNGFFALSQIITSYTTEGTYRSDLPHKTIATRAGLGWIGKSTLLVTEKFGSAVRLTSILTNAPLVVEKSINASICGECLVCKNICIGSAISGKNWNIHLDRDDFFDPNSCRTAAREIASTVGLDGAFCGKCIVYCPYTQNYIKKSGVLI